MSDYEVEFRHGDSYSIYSMDEEKYYKLQELIESLSFGECIESG